MKVATAKDFKLGECGKVIHTTFKGTQYLCRKPATWTPTRRGLGYDSPETPYVGEWGWRCGTHDPMKGVERYWYEWRVARERHEARRRREAHEQEVRKAGDRVIAAVLAYYETAGVIGREESKDALFDAYEAYRALVPEV